MSWWLVLDLLGSAAVIWSARGGYDVLLVDMARFPRGKTCGDGLTPWIRQHPITGGLEMHGWGRRQRIEWPTQSLPDYGTVITRTELDYRLVELALAGGVRTLLGVRAASAHRHDAGSPQSRCGQPMNMWVSTPRRCPCDRCSSATGSGRNSAHSLGASGIETPCTALPCVPFLRADQQWEWLVAHLGPNMPKGGTMAGYGWLVVPAGQIKRKRSRSPALSPSAVSALAARQTSASRSA
ncbi:hypothetical protein MycrhN_3015 [Mycolicibacterium rhodesiae NBB3]|uniref:Uncharacterized protein n=1 Tax=Mycolicibacterium rhodesiae (strain NBB3) TaxID=710685 RepID=G8RKF3_MYCRN|nr:hypothetical protein [Mycolicibacterium rhodesiae]AEV73555.1 hypothetical protein MycrhN_3015 [Mycolicibacterium rhodesiae NBB3]